jgi:hypothetical protein
MTPCSLVGRYQRPEGTSYLHLHASCFCKCFTYSPIQSALYTARIYPCTVHTSFPVPDDTGQLSQSTYPWKRPLYRATVFLTSLYVLLVFIRAITSPIQVGQENGPLEGHRFLTVSPTSLYLLIYSRPSFLPLIQILEYGLQSDSCSYFIHGPGLGPSSPHGPIRTIFPFQLSVFCPEDGGSTFLITTG